MDWTEFTPVKEGIGPEGVSDETHEIQYRHNSRHPWTRTLIAVWTRGFKYRYRLHTPDLTQLSDADLDAQAAAIEAERKRRAAIEAERKRREDDLGEWVELLAKMVEAMGRDMWASSLRRGRLDEENKAAAHFLRDHTRRAVDEALAEARKAGDIAMGDQV